MNIEKMEIQKQFDLAFKFHQEKNFIEAKKIYEKILTIKPNYKEVLFLLGTLLLQIEDLKKAEIYLIKAIEADPNYAQSHNNLGIIFRKSGKLTKSIKCFEKAIIIDSSYIDPLINLANTLTESGEFRKAINFYEKALLINSENPDIYYNLGLAHYNLKEIGKSFICYAKAINLNPNHINSNKNISILLRSINLSDLNEQNTSQLKQIFLHLFKRNDIEHRDLTSNAIFVLLKNDSYKEVFDLTNLSVSLESKKIENFLEDELLQLILQKSFNTNFFLEKILTEIRKYILLNIFHTNIKNFNLNFVISLAEQCFINEYIFQQNNQEIEYLDKLKNKIENDKEINELELAIFACYVPLHSNKFFSEKLLNYKSKDILFNDLINLQIKEPLKEKQLYSSIKSFGNITNTISKKVMEQYEVNPFPRWRFTYNNLKENPISVINKQIKPNKIEFNNLPNNPSILIAGCGTGKHIFNSQIYNNANILAVDLSKKSLAYAKRKIEEANIDNVELLHSDILELKNYNKRFDIIECMGVIHHMESPIEGLKILLNLLEDEGYLKLGLYSEIGRKDIAEAKKIFSINQSNKLSIKDIRNLRYNISEKKQNRLIYKTDFYVTSSFRDLLLHEKEHYYTIPQISKILSKLRLEFLGFSDEEIKNIYSKSYPEDKKNISFEKWNAFEQKNPKSFKSMYNFWLKKKL